MADPHALASDSAIQQMMQIISTAGRLATTNADQNSLERAEALEALQQIATSFADIAEGLDALIRHHRGMPDLALALREAVSSVRPPDVNVTVQPAAVTQLEPQVHVTVQPAAVTVQEAADKPGQQWRIEVERISSAMNAPAKSYTVTRL
jgi:hypothetical protein